MFKKLLPAMVAFALVATACGNHEGGDEATPEENAGSMEQTTEPMEETTPAEEETAPMEETSMEEGAEGEMEHSEEAHH